MTHPPTPRAENRVGALGSTAPTRTGQTRLASDPLPRREGPPRVRLRVRVPVEVLEAAMSGLAALDEHTASVLSERDVALAPPPTG
ncbi:hypothetical protein ACGIF2_06805 [Cellulomonas sp. P22]